MKLWKPASLSLICLALGACSESGDSVPVGGGAVNQDLSYELTENGCTTGRHSFGSYPELCSGLQDNMLNNGCALNLRAQHFMRTCQGQSFSPNDGSYRSDPSNPNYPGYPSYPSLPDQSYPNGVAGGRADVQISGFRNLYYRIDSSMNAGFVECSIKGREFRLTIDHPEYANLGRQSRLLSLSFTGRGKRFPESVRFGSDRDASLRVLLPGVRNSWAPVDESCDVSLGRQSGRLEASFDCRLDGREQGRRQTIRMNATVNCELERR